MIIVGDRRDGIHARTIDTHQWRRASGPASLREECLVIHDVVQVRSVRKSACSRIWIHIRVCRKTGLIGCLDVSQELSLLNSNVLWSTSGWFHRGKLRSFWDSAPIEAQMLGQTVITATPGYFVTVLQRQ